MSRNDCKQWVKGRKSKPVADWTPATGDVMLTASERKRRLQQSNDARKSTSFKRASQGPSKAQPVREMRTIVPVVETRPSFHNRPVELRPLQTSGVDSLFPKPAFTGQKIEAVLHFDGSANPNPGPNCQCGYVLRLPAGRLIRKSIHLGQGTNNTAEYHGLLHGMRAALEAGVTDLEIYGDSRLVIEGVRKMRPWAKGKPHLEALKKTAQDLVRQFEHVDLNWVPRDENAEADELSTAQCGAWK